MEHIDVIKSRLNEGKSVHDIYRELKQTCGASAPTFTSVNYWANTVRSSHHHHHHHQQQHHLNHSLNNHELSGSNNDTHESTMSSQEIAHESKRIEKRFREFIRVRVLDGMQTSQIFKEIGDVFGRDAPSRSTVYNWASRMKSNRESMGGGGGDGGRHNDLDCSPNSSNASTHESSSAASAALVDHSTVPPSKRACTSTDMMRNESVGASETAPPSSSASGTSERQDIPYVKTETLDEGRGCARSTSLTIDDEAQAATGAAAGVTGAAKTAAAAAAVGKSSTGLAVAAAAARPVAADPDQKVIKMTTMSGFDRGLEPERIIADTILDGQRLFLVKWKNSTIKDLVFVETAKIKCPHIVMKFYEDQLYAEQNECVIIGAKA